MHRYIYMDHSKCINEKDIQIEFEQIEEAVGGKWNLGRRTIRLSNH